MKAKLSPKTTLRIAMQGKAVTKVLTVFLCAFSFALFALASTGYTYSKKSITRGRSCTIPPKHSGRRECMPPFGGGGYLPL